MELIKFTISVIILAVGCAYFIALLLAVMGRCVKFLGLQDDAPSSIPGTPAGQIMPKAGTDYAAIAVAIAAATRESSGKN